MDQLQQQLLLHYELRLLRCTHPFPLKSPPSIPLLQSQPSTLPLIEQVVSLIESGQFLSSLSSPASQTIFQFPSLSDSDPARFYAELERAVESYLSDGAADKIFLVFSVAIAAFFAFLQRNFTGPVIELPSVPLPWLSVEAAAAASEWEAWARIQLIHAGSHLAAKFSNLQYLLFAKILLMRTRDLLFEVNITCGFGTSAWWSARLILLHQQILDEHCSSLFDSLQVLLADSLNHFGDVQKVKSYWGLLLDEEAASTIVSMLQLEAGLVEHTFGRVDSARKYIKDATSTVGIEISVTGALGFRTIHQVEPKVQRVLVMNRSSLRSGGSSDISGPSQQSDGLSDAKSQHNCREIGEASDVLVAPRIVGTGGNEVSAPNVIQNGHTPPDVSLTLIQQEVVLAQCLLIEKSSRFDEMQRWDMAPYIEAIDSQQSSNFSIRSFCNFLRIRWESPRTRTKERALLLMEKMVQDLSELSPLVLERIHSRFGVYIPSVPLLRKEFGELLISCGLIGEALKTYEDLELWDNLIYCYGLLEKRAAANELIKARLLETPNDPRLWCSLGDVTNDDACFLKALEVSNDRSARAKRSLARSAYNRRDYERSEVLWESAMALNSLYQDGWFALGSAALKARDFNKALEGFTRAVQLNPDNGEAWNNIACLHMMRKNSDAAFIAFKQALKYRRSSWEMWENYGQVAADVGNFFQAIEAIKMVLDLSGNKRYDGVLLERIMQELERRAVPHHASSDKNCCTATDSGHEVPESRDIQHLMESLGKVLRQIVLSIGTGDAWGFYARWHKLKGDLTMCSEALQKQVRSYQGSDVGNDINQFTKLARSSLELCKLYMEISYSTGSRKELHSAGMHLRNTIKRASAFSETEEFKALQVCLDEVETRLESDAPPMS